MVINWIVLPQEWIWEFGLVTTWMHHSSVYKHIQRRTSYWESLKLLNRTTKCKGVVNLKTSSWVLYSSMVTSLREWQSSYWKSKQVYKDDTSFKEHPLGLWGTTSDIKTMVTGGSTRRRVGADLIQVFSGRELAFTFATCHRDSVCLSSVVCDVGAPYSGGWTFRQFFSPYDSPETLIFWCRKSLVGDAPIPLKFLFKVTDPLSNSKISTNIGS